MGTTLDKPLHYLNSMRILVRTSLHFYLTFTHSLIAYQVFGVVVVEKFSVDIDSSAIDSTLDQFSFIYFFLPINNFIFSLCLFILLYFICAVTWS